MPRTKAIAIQNLRAAQAAAGPSAKSKKKHPAAPAAEEGSAVAPRKPHRWRPGTVAQREIRRYQRSTKNVLPRSPVRRIIKALLAKHSTSGDARMTRNAFEAVYEMTSSVLTEALAGAERVRFAENKVASIRARHLRVGRGLVGVHCLSDAQIPLEVSLCARPPSKSSKSAADEPSSTDAAARADVGSDSE